MEVSLCLYYIHLLLCELGCVSLIIPVTLRYIRFKPAGFQPLNTKIILRPQILHHCFLELPGVEVSTAVVPLGET